MRGSRYDGAFCIYTDHAAAESFEPGGKGMRGKGLSALQNSIRVLRADRSKAERKKSLSAPWNCKRALHTDRSKAERKKLSASLNYMCALHADRSVNEKVADRVDTCFYRLFYMDTPLDAVIRHYYGECRIV